MQNRRALLITLLGALPPLLPSRALAWRAARPAWADDLAPGRGVVVLLRHATAPGTFDPPGFRLDDCRTQRNLSEAGRAEARAIGHGFAAHGIPIRRVRSSPWCRCLDTATLAFGQAEPWAPLGSPVHLDASARASALQSLREALQAAAEAGGVEVWVSHMFIQADLTGQHTGPGDGLVLRPIAGQAHGAPEVIARLQTLR